MSEKREFPHVVAEWDVDRQPNQRAYYRVVALTSGQAVLEYGASVDAMGLPVFSEVWDVSNTMLGKDLGTWIMSLTRKEEA